MAALADSDAAEGQASGIVVTGGRASSRTIADSATPIDVIGGDKIVKTGKKSLKEALSILVPSFNYGTTNGNVHNNIAKPYSLRGLGAAYTLVLVNGKRRHHSSLLLNSNIDSSGATPVDIDLIPVTAIDRIEVLRDGAAAQYGSDAIAGVINIILKSGEGGSIFALAGQTYNGDGENLQAAADLGFKLANGGQLHLAVEGKANGRTDRNDDARGTFYFPGDPREATAVRRGSYNGDPRLRQFSGLANLTMPLSPDIELYGNGTVAVRNGQGFQTRRRPNENSNLPDVYPDGYVPNYILDETDFQLLAGLRGQYAGWKWDLSSSFGRDRSTSSADTINPSLGPTGPQHFKLYTLTTDEWVTNFDVSRQVAIGLASPLRIATGIEYRRERYKVGQGDPLSYANGGYTFTSGPFAGMAAAVGVQGVVSIDADDDGTLRRSNIAGYLELGADIVKGWSVAIAGRGEHFSDSAGDTFSFKFNTRYDPTPWIGLRGTISTGFRAPSLAQTLYGERRYVVQTVAGQRIQVPSKNFRADSPVAIALGAMPLKPEHTVNYSVGVALRPADRLSITVDAYQINVDDRIAQTTALNGAGVDALLVAAGLQPGVYAQYFTNAVDTRSRGLDVVSTYQLELNDLGSLVLSAAANWNQTKITRVRDNPPELASLGSNLVLFDRVQQGALTVGYPKSKMILSAAWSLDRLHMTLRGTRYGSVTQRGTPVSGVDDRTYSAKWLTDVEVSYALFDNLRLAVGANNVFDVYPDPVGIITTGGSGRYGTFSPFGSTGGFYYGRVSYDF